jgi:hypothetical protein
MRGVVLLLLVRDYHFFTNDIACDMALVTSAERHYRLHFLLIKQFL